MLFHYIASDPNGKIQEGELEVDSLQNLLQALAAQELRPVSVKAMAATGIMARGLFGKITLTDKVFLTRYLSLMLRVGTDLLSAINILMADFDKPAMRNFLMEVKANLSKGQPFYQAFAKYPKVFSPVFINLIKAAEVSGNLQQTFDSLSVSLEKESELRKRVRAALIYPAILLVLSVAIFSFLSLFALPRIAKVFTEANLTPPAFSRFVFTVGLFFGEHVIAFLGGTVLLLIGLWMFLFRTTTGRRVGAQLMSNMPFVRSVYRDLAVQRFASTFSSLLKAGMPILQATKITADVVGSEPFRVSLNRIADEGLARGLTLGEAFRREVIFPNVVSNLVAISEKAGHLEEVLETLSDFYASNVDSSIKALVAVLEPLLLIIMGAMVGSIAIAIIIPIYQLTTQF